MAANGWQKYDSITLGTGNILENEEFKKAKNPTQEVSRRTFDAGVDRNRRREHSHNCGWPHYVHSFSEEIKEK
jgi:hypothetical protein